MSPINLSSVIFFILAAAKNLAAKKCWVDGHGFATFDDGHTYSVADADDDFSNAKGPFKMIRGGDVGDALTDIREGAIRAHYGDGLILGTHTGFTFYDVAPGDGADEAWFTYRVKFSDGFQWTKGGKLPGLCGGPTNGKSGKKGRTCPTGCSSVSRDDGFSTRLMWREDGAIVTYAYYPDKPRSIRCGEDWVWDGKFTTGVWHDIAMRIKLNTVSGNSAREDGVFEAWLDGRKVLTRDNVRFRHRDDVKVTRTYLTSYVGGSIVEKFAPSQDQYALFNNFKSAGGSRIGTCEGEAGSGAEGGATVFAESRSGGAGGSGNSGGGGESGEPPSKIGKFEMYGRGRGWDVPGSYARYRAPRAARTPRERVRYCHGKCKHGNGCVGFTVYGNGCYLKATTHVQRNAKFYGRGGSGWRWMYEKPVAGVLDQSGAGTAACGGLGDSCCYEGAAGGTPICDAGACAIPGGNATTATASAGAPCICAEATCVTNLDFCPPGVVCDQSASLPECGTAGSPCCDGISCDEETADGAGLVCDQAKGACVIL